MLGDKRRSGRGGGIFFLPDTSAGVVGGGSAERVEGISKNEVSKSGVFKNVEVSKAEASKNEFHKNADVSESVEFSEDGDFSENIGGSKNAELSKAYMLLGYISSDYANAVRDGKVISEFEFEEMVDFCSQVFDIFKRSSVPPDILSISILLCDEIKGKVQEHRVRELAKSLLDFLMSRGVAPIPSSIPDFRLGQKIYSNLCASCHGRHGDGIRRAGLQGGGSVDRDILASMNPPPPSLKSDHISPVRVYLITKNGIEGTSMPAFELDEKSRWSLSFLVSYLRYAGDSGETDLNSKDDMEFGDRMVDMEREDGMYSEGLLSFEVFLNSVTMDNKTLEEIFGWRGAASIRKGVFKTEVFPLVYQGVGLAREAFEEGDLDKAKLFLTLSYMFFENIETKLKIREPARTALIESIYMQVIKSMERMSGLDYGDVEREREREKVISLLTRFSDEISHLSGEGRGDIGKVFGSFIIVLREGFEAMIIVASILSVVSIVGVSVLPIWLGAISGVLSGIIMWGLSGSVMNINKELMEGIFTIFAVLVIVWVSFWILEKTRVENIRRFVERAKVQAFRRNYIWLFLLAFFATAREAGETVLFLRALGEGIRLGAFLGFVSLLLVAYLIYFAKKSLPIRKFFILTNIILNITAVTLLGKAIAEFQEIGLIPVTLLPLPSFDIFEFFGIYPTLQTVFSQLVLAVFLFGSMLIYLKRREIPKLTS